jgi:hypothetical protein
MAYLISRAAQRPLGLTALTFLEASVTAFKIVATCDLLVVQKFLTGRAANKKAGHLCPANFNLFY